MPQLITPLDVLTSSGKYPSREQSDECVTGVRINAADLAERVSKLLGALGITSAKVSSGFRTKAANAAANGAKLSAHQTGQAVDLEDNDGTLGAAITSNIALLDTYDLYLENPYYTVKTVNGVAYRWVHLQSRRTPSGRRVFVP